LEFEPLAPSPWLAGALGWRELEAETAGTALDRAGGFALGVTCDISARFVGGGSGERALSISRATGRVVAVKVAAADGNAFHTGAPDSFRKVERVPRSTATAPPISRTARPPQTSLVSRRLPVALRAGAFAGYSSENVAVLCVSIRWSSSGIGISTRAPTSSDEDTA
jgi:hypothetical protein